MTCDRGRVKIKSTSAGSATKPSRPSSPPTIPTIGWTINPCRTAHRVKPASDANRLWHQAHFFKSLTKRRRNRPIIIRFNLTTGKADLSCMMRQMFGALGHQNMPVTRRSQQRNQNRGRPIRHWRRVKPHCRHIGKRVQTGIKTLLQIQMGDLQRGVVVMAGLSDKRDIRPLTQKIDYGSIHQAGHLARPRHNRQAGNRPAAIIWPASRRAPQYRGEDRAIAQQRNCSGCFMSSKTVSSILV